MFLVKAFFSKYTKPGKNDKMHLIFSSIVRPTFHRKVKKAGNKECTAENCCSPLLDTILSSLITWYESKITLCFSTSPFPPCLTSFLLGFCPDPWFLTFSYPISIFQTYPNNGPPSSTTSQGCGRG